MSSERSRWVGRAAALLVAVAVVGALLGVAMEDVIYGNAPTELEAAEVRANAEFPSPPSNKRSPAEEAILARALVHFPPYPNATRRPEVLAADYLGPDAPIAVAWFTTKDKPRQVLEHYRKLLLEKGLPVLQDDYGENGGYVGYWSPVSEEVRLVSVLYQDGESMVFVSAGQVAPAIGNKRPLPPWLPIPMTVVDPQLLTLRLEGFTQYQVAGTSTEGTLVEAESAWRDTLRSRGWQMGPSSEGQGEVVAFDVSHEGMRGQLSLRRPQLLQPGVEFNLSLMQRGNAAPERGEGSP
ncbi:hypothetical protein D7X55_12400 [Corallococcus sp. AB049A]|uniref:Uncharacterized protein n=1 Tax=Corallococcus interemptor TaxID=2316720 RepID=A0A3A8Q160_9BACT|nr:MULTISPECIES: hypothetical protein [Corallococcus]RKH50830.1 hypothetical protein D7Y23_11920 [Corallococcus sp. AB050B]RKH61818.1 hypothetical protein D7X96_30955 [Corallococcus interemptor]RKI68475.1 hypothetical protein D7X55_12400 [Corallococcus sp. AB049A]